MIYFCVQLLPQTELVHSPCQWVMLDESARQINSGCDMLDELYLQFDAQHDVRVVVLVPGETVVMTEVDIESQHLRHLKTALPYMVEEQLVDDIEDVHLATSPKIGVGRHHVAVVAHTELIDWLDILYSAGLKPSSIAPEYLFLPDTLAGVRVLLDGDRALIQNSAYAGQSVERDNLSFYLQLLTQQDPELRTVVLIASDEDIVAKSAIEKLKVELDQQLVGQEVQVQLYMESAFELLAKSAVLSRDYALNLLQGGYQSREAALGQRSPWLAIAGLLFGFTVLELLLYLGSGFWFSKQAEVSKVGAVALYRDLFPKERRVLNPKRQFQAHLNSEQAVGYSREFLLMLQIVTEQLNDKGLRVKNLRFQAGDGLLIELEATAIDSLEAYSQRLAAQSLQVELLSAIEEDDGVVGRLRVEAR